MASIDIGYLQTGNAKQRRVFKVLTEFRVLEKLWAFDPILVGTIPISVDIDSSDIDLICSWSDKQTFRAVLEKEFGALAHFNLLENPDNESIVDLKKQGHKTEPAFAIALGLSGDPYIELLKFEE